MNNIALIFDHPLALKSYSESGALTQFREKFRINVICVDIESDYENHSLVKLRKFQKFLLGINSNLYWAKIANHSKLAKLMVSRDFMTGKISFSAIKRTRYFNQVIFFARLLRILRLPYFTYIPTSLSRHPEILNACKIIYVSVGGSNSLNDALFSLAKRKSIPFGIVFENWDNIFTKAVFNKKPRSVGVWGQQAVEHAEKVHKLASDRVKFIGSPRVDFLIEKYERLSKLMLKDRTGILFAGGSINLREELAILEKLCSYLKTFERKLSLSYLPHPKYYREIFTQQGRFAKQGIRLLPTRKLTNHKDFPQPPRLEEYPDYYAEARLTISSFSTMNLESYLLKIPTIAIDLQYPSLANDYSSTRELMPHLSDSRIKNIFNVVDSADELINKFTSLITREQIDLPQDTFEGQYFYCRDIIFKDRFEKFATSLER